MDDFEVQLWSKLPCELVERSLSFLPVPVLLTLRTVCKRWNSIISKPEFGALCIQHARRQDARFIVLREERGWSFLDLTAKRWYTIKHDKRTALRPLIRIDSMAMDGGLVCHHRARETAVYVANPVATTFRRLPPCAAIAASVRPLMNMVVDNAAHTFKIFVIPNGPEGERAMADKPRMVIYESTTDQWCNSASRITPLVEFPFRAMCSVFLHGLLYVLMSPSTSMRIATSDCLWSYNYIEDAWKNTCLDIPHIRSLQCPRLIVSDNRLFLASWRQKMPEIQEGSDLSYKTWPWTLDGWTYEIYELHLGDRACSAVFEMAEAGMRQVLEVPDVPERRFSSHYLKAFGCCKSIVSVCMSTGMSLMYHMNTSRWERLPCKSLQEANSKETTRVLDPDNLDVGKPMNLILPVNTLCHQQHELEVRVAPEIGWRL